MSFTLLPLTTLAFNRLVLNMKIMKKKIILIVFMAFSVIGYSQINQAEIIYKVKIYPKKDSTKKIDPKISRMMKLVFQQIKRIESQLIFNGNRSVFKQVDELENEGDRSPHEKMASSIIGLTSQYYSDIKNKSIIRVTEFDGITYNISSSFIDDWKLIDEFKLIDNYKCFKAITTKRYIDRHGRLNSVPVTAWYNPQIPIPIGPKNYVGLPGLILELNEGVNRLTYYVTSIKLNPNSKLKIDKLPKGKKMTEEEFSKLTSSLSKKFINSLKN